jgi:predicted nuclease of predicted toxin-antitoxin system
MTGFLLDGNVPGRLRFSPGLPVVPLSSIGQNPSDSQIWDFAKQNDLVIVSKDADFSDRLIASSPPPRVVQEN